MENHFFNAHHSPIGSFASFTLGYPGGKGGLGLGLEGPANQNVFIGLENEEGKLQVLPFFEDPGAEDESSRFDVCKSEVGEKTGDSTVFRFDQSEVERDFKVSTDTWQAGNLTFRIISPVFSVPDPETAKEQELKLALVPAVLVELTVDNQNGDRLRKAFFGYEGNDPYSRMRRLNDGENGRLQGVGQGLVTLIASKDDNISSGLGFNVGEVVRPDLVDNLLFGLGGVGALVMEVPAGEVCTLRCAVCFYRGGIATAGLETSYFYTKYFPNIEAVADFALDNFEELKTRAEAADAMVEDSQLSTEQKFMLSHAVRSYYGSTQLMQLAEGSPFWLVNEGEYRMLNTFDLMVDQLFFEMKMNPWTVRNELEMFIERFSYQDKVRFPGDDNEYPGGISFTHDMGVANVISRPNFSSYELFGLDGCFSHMTHEQLVNWILCAAVYGQEADDQEWLAKHIEIFKECFASMQNRDHPEPEKRNGVMSLDSSRCKGGGEITTFDSLDISLGQARNNIYLAVKCWAAYVALEKILSQNECPELAQEAGIQAERCAKTLVGHVTADGYIPAVIDEDNDSRIISAIEGLIFPLFSGCPEVLEMDGRFKLLLQALKTHLETILVPGTCLFPEGSWKLSSTSDNSWLSKIFLSQFVAREILGMEWDEKGVKADREHCKWLLNEQNCYFAWSDQMVAGVAKGSKYYPRGVTSILWLTETR